MKATKIRYQGMKKIKYIIVTILTVAVFSSCNDWLYLEPEDGIISQEYWQSESDLFNGLMGCYASMLGDVSQKMFLWGEMRADFLEPYTGSNSSFNMLAQGDIEPNNAFCNWGSLYTTINYCNTVLAKADGILKLDDSFTEDELKQYKAEAHAIRGLMYFYLTRVYRDVPIVLQPSESDLQEYTIPKSNYEDVWAQIERDLLQALDYDIKYTYNTTQQEDKGRITAYTVYAILADFYLWTEQYDKSVEYSNLIINSGKFWLINGDMEWFEKLYETENSHESIFELQFDEDIANPMYSMCITKQEYRARPDIMENFWPTDDLLPHADSADIRSDRGSYISSSNYLIYKFYGKTRYSRRSNTLQETDFNWIVYRYADVLLMKAEAMAAQLEVGDEAKAAEILALIRKVRKRANASEITDEGEPDTRYGLLNYILNERAREFAFEGKRWFDVLRNAKRTDTQGNAYSQLSIIELMYESFISADKLSAIKSKVNYQDGYFLYLPIPESDVLHSNGVLEQNPFYE